MAAALATSMCIVSGRLFDGDVGGDGREWRLGRDRRTPSYFNADNGGNFNNRLDLDQYPAVSTRFKIEFASPTKTNLFANPNAFSGGSWSKSASTIVTGQTDPYSGTTASNMLETATTVQHYVTQPLTKAATTPTYRIWFWAKPVNGRNFARIQVGQSAFAAGESAYYDLVNGNAGGFFAFGGMGTPIPFCFPDNNGFVKCGCEFTSIAATESGADLWIGDPPMARITMPVISPRAPLFTLLGLDRLFDTWLYL